MFVSPKPKDIQFNTSRKYSYLEAENSIFCFLEWKVTAQLIVGALCDIQPKCSCCWPSHWTKILSEQLKIWLPAQESGVPEHFKPLIFFFLPLHERISGPTRKEKAKEEEERPQHTLVQPTVERRSDNQHRSKIPQPARQAFPTQQPSSQDPKQEHRESLI